ncbi:MAG: sterol desaturase family protein [Burkholderiaceae bacterium]|nr:sterol desaturase family protein [Burkholderiaceae bacterium]
MNLLQRLWQADLPEISERHRRKAEVFMIVFAVAYAVALLATYHYAFIGPVLGEDTSFTFLLDFLRLAGGTGEQLGIGATLFWLLSLAIVGNAAYRALVIHRAYRAHATAFGRPLPMNQLVAYVTTNLLNIFFAPLILLLLAGVAKISGHNWQDGLAAMTYLRQFAERCVAMVPTVVVLPRPLAFLVVFTVHTFVHYWMHRFSHTRRFLWLVIHRPHHVTEDISPVTTLPSVMSFPLVFVMMLPYLVGFGALSKLFYPEPLYFEMIVVMLIMMVAEMYNHSGALYDHAAHTPWLRRLGFMLCFGAYHLLHHASDRDERFKDTCYTANLGPGPFSCWDKLFGTFRELEETMPLTGITDRPALVNNPLRLLAAGITQIAYELYWNKDWRTRLWIIFGSANFYPPISKDFALAEDVHKRSGSTDISPYVRKTGDNCQVVLHPGIENEKLQDNLSKLKGMK